MSVYKFVPGAILTAVIDALLSPIIFPRYHLKLLDKVDMPAEHKEAARASFARAKELDKQIRLFKLRAPFVMLRVLRSLPWDAEKLPDEFWQYDNEVSINGDRSPWQYGADGVSRPAPCPLDDTQDARALCYYAPGHHPRSPEARYVWLGSRNRASLLAFNLGPEASADTEAWGDTSASKSRSGIMVRRMGAEYELFAYKVLGPICIRTRYGFKIGNVITYGAARAMVVTIPFSLLASKKPAK